MPRCWFDLPTRTLWLVPTVESSHTRFCTSPPFCIHDRYRRRVVIDLALVQRPPSVDFARIWCGVRHYLPSECQKAASKNAGSDASKSWFLRHQLKTRWTLLLNASPCGSRCEASSEFDRWAVLPVPSKVYSPSIVLDTSPSEPPPLSFDALQLNLEQRSCLQEFLLLIPPYSPYSSSSPFFSFLLLIENFIADLLSP